MIFCIQLSEQDTTEPDAQPKTTKKPRENLPNSPQKSSGKSSGNSESRGRLIPEEISEEEGCPAWKPDWGALSKIQSSISLDPNRFLIPVLTYGPNNQLRHGFKLDLCSLAPRHQFENHFKRIQRNNFSSYKIKQNNCSTTIL